MKMFFAMIWLLYTVSVQAVQEVTFVEDPTPPFILGKQHSEPTGGITLQVIRKVFESIPGVKPRFLDLVPWKRALIMVETGNADAIMHILKNGEREENYFYSDVMYPGRSLLFYSMEVFPQGFSWEKYKDLENNNICVLRGTSAESFLSGISRKEEAALSIAVVNSLEQCIKMLQIGRVDIFIDNEAVGYDLIRRTGMKGKIRGAEKPLYSKNFYMAFSRKTEAHKLLPKINDVLKKLHEEGTIKKIIHGEM